MSRGFYAFGLVALVTLAAMFLLSWESRPIQAYGIVLGIIFVALAAVGMFQERTRAANG